MSRDPAVPARRNHGLRLTLAVALGLVFEILRGALVPPLAAVIALQLLALSGPRPTAKTVVGLFVIIAGASLFETMLAHRTPSGLLSEDMDFDNGERSEEHTTELQSLMRTSYAAFGSKNKKYNTQSHIIV